MGQGQGVRQKGVSPGTLGSSGICVMNLSRRLLNSSIPMFRRFLMYLDRALKKRGPEHWKLVHLMVLTLIGPVNFLSLHDGLFLVFSSFDISMPQLGILLSKIFHIYII